MPKEAARCDGGVSPRHELGYSTVITRRLRPARISVVISFYGEYGDFRDHCLASLARQGFKDFDIVFIQDGPTMLESRLQSDLSESGLDYVYLVNTSNVGALESRIRASCEARGDYIAFLDHDDAYSDNFLTVMHQVAVGSGADVVECAISNVTPDGGSQLFRRFSCGEKRFGDEIARQYLRGFSHNNLWNKLVLKEHFEAAALELSCDMSTLNWNFFEDLLLSAIIYKNVRSYVATCDTTYLYMQRPGSNANPTDIKKMAAAIRQIGLVAKYVNCKFSAIGSRRDLYLFHRRETKWGLEHMSRQLRRFRPQSWADVAVKVKLLAIAFVLKCRILSVHWLALKFASLQKIASRHG